MLHCGIALIDGVNLSLPVRAAGAKLENLADSMAWRDYSHPEGVGTQNSYIENRRQTRSYLSGFNMIRKLKTWPY